MLNIWIVTGVTTTGYLDRGFPPLILGGDGTLHYHPHERVGEGFTHVYLSMFPGLNF